MKAQCTVLLLSSPDFPTHSWGILGTSPSKWNAVFHVQGVHLGPSSGRHLSHRFWKIAFPWQVLLGSLTRLGWGWWMRMVWFRPTHFPWGHHFCKHPSLTIKPKGCENSDYVIFISSLLFPWLIFIFIFLRWKFVQIIDILVVKTRRKRNENFLSTYCGPGTLLGGLDLILCIIFIHWKISWPCAMVNFMCYLDRAKGCPTSGGNIMSGFICDGTSRTDWHLSLWGKMTLANAGGHFSARWGPK